MNTQRKVQNLVVMALLIISGHATSNYSPEMAATLMRHYYPNMTTQETTAPVLQQLEYKQEPTASTVAITTPDHLNDFSFIRAYIQIHPFFQRNPADGLGLDLG